MTALQVAAVGAAMLCGAVALFQVGLALGLPLGDATFGGRAPTEDGVLSRGFRAIAAINGIVLVLFAWTFLARGGLTDAGPLGEGFVFWATWGIVGFLALNTVGNLAAPHPVERWVMGSITLTLVVLGCLLALRAPR